VIVWTDCGTDDGAAHVPVPGTKSYQAVATSLTFCPVFFENDLQENSISEASGPNGTDSHDKVLQQPLAALPARYGETLDWESLSTDAVLILQEWFQFQSAATMQYFNLLRKTINHTLARADVVGKGGLRMEDMIQFDYTKTVLARWASHLRSLCQALSGCSSVPFLKTPQGHGMRAEVDQLLINDLKFLLEEAKAITELCESGKSAIMSDFSITESERISRETQLVTQLTKTTNRLTFIFLPMSFVTSVFGMNFRQLGSGDLNIWLWVAVSIPLLTLCIILVEWGRSILHYLRQLICGTARFGLP
jgi:hypothetical protein